MKNIEDIICCRMYIEMNPDDFKKYRDLKDGMCNNITDINMTTFSLFGITIKFDPSRKVGKEAVVYVLPTGKKIEVRFNNFNKIYKGK